MTTPVDWDLAGRLARRGAGQEPFSESYHRDRLVSDFEAYTEQATELVAETTGLRPPGRATACVVDRDGWIEMNTRSFERLLRPLTDRIGEQMGSSRLAPVARKVAGAELGVVLGWMSRRVLGQYDLLVVDDDEDGDAGDAEGDVVYYVGPNVLALEKRWGFPPHEFRLWLALHEVTHRAQFMGVPWMRGHFSSLVTGLLGSVDADPDRMFDGLRRMLENRSEAKEAVADGGLSAVFATPEQREEMDRIAGLMSLLEGHGDVTMTRAGGDLVPSAERFHRVLHERRSQVSGAGRIMQKLIGIDAKMAQYAQGEAFLEAVEADHGPQVVDFAWASPDHLPTLAEIRAPERWLERVVQPALAAG